MRHLNVSARRAPQELEVWMPYRRPRPARLRLFCLPYAGGSASVYRSWSDSLPPEVELCAVQPPGRERRLRERPFTRMESFVEALAEVLEPLFDLPFVLLGHSLGAKAAYALSRRLRRGDGPQPVHLIVSGSRAPHMPSAERPLHRLPHDELIEELRKLEGTPPDVLENRELMELMLPLLRADFELVETYEPGRGELLDCPVSAYGGSEDADVPREAVEGWREVTRGPFRCCVFGGHHFFLHDRKQEMLAEIRRDLAPYLVS